MYIRPAHAELDVPTLHAFIREHALGLFTTAIPHATHPTIQTSHIPFVLDRPASPSPSPDADAGDASDPPTKPPLGVLRGHMARANPQAKAVIDHLKSRGVEPASSGFLSSWLGSSASTSATDALPGPSSLSDEVLVLFNAPEHSYITPKWYTETKPLNGKVVPTWNYAAVQVYGRARIYYEQDEATASFLQTQVQDLSRLQEELAGHEKPWEVSDAPTSYVDALKKAIIGIEIEITRCEGRFKLSQEMGDGDWKGVVQGFKALDTDKGKKLAGMVQERGKQRGLDSSGSAVDPAPAPAAPAAAA
jgi:transcriptional regulator